MVHTYIYIIVFVVTLLPKINFASSILTECTYSYGLFLALQNKMISGKRESVS